MGNLRTSIRRGQMNALYNENNPFAAEWLGRLVERGLVGPGRVDRRSITELRAADVAGPGQRHFFAGIGGWSYALRLAGIPDDSDIWTGSCPCQPFSSAGARAGTRDPRHLWPAWFALIEQCRPAIILGEQVASRDGLVWLDAVYADLERCGYAVGASDLCAASVGAPHRRQRLYFVAHTDEAGRTIERARRLPRHDAHGHDVAGRGTDGDVADASGDRRQACERARPAARSARRGEPAGVLGDTGGDGAREHARELSGDESERALRSVHGDHAPVAASAARDMADTEGERCDTWRRGGPSGRAPLEPDRHGATREFWRDADWIECSDGTARPVEPGTFPLADGVPCRVGRLRGYGNAIVPQLAAAFVEVALDAIGERLGCGR